jgi:phage minor structural protein
MVGGVLGTKTFGQPTTGSQVAESWAVISNPKRYRLEVWDRTLSLTLSDVPNFSACTVTETLNEASTIELTVPAAEDSAAYLKRPSRIRLYDVRGNTLETFIIHRPTQDNSSGGDRVTVTGASLITLLGREKVQEEYHFEESDGRTVRQHVDALLAMQENSPRIRHSGMDSAISTAIAALHLDKGQSLLEGLQALQQVVGGYFWVDANGNLLWKVRRGSNIGIEYHYGVNLDWLKWSSDNQDVVTKLYFYGQAEGDTRLSLTDAGLAHDYLMADSQYVTEHGVIVGYFEDSTIKDTATLVKRANAYLAQVQNPELEYEAGVRDTSQLEEYSYSETFAVRVGNTVTFYDDRLSAGSIKRDILSVTRDLTRPTNVTVRFGKIPSTLLDTIKRMERTARQVEVPTRLHDLVDGYPPWGTRDGDILYDPDTGRWNGANVLGRYPNQAVTLKPLGGGHWKIPSNGSLAGIPWSAGDTYYRVLEGGRPEWGGIAEGGTLVPFIDSASLLDAMQAAMAQWLADSGVMFRRVFNEGSAEPDGGYLPTDMLRMDDGVEKIRNTDNDGWSRWSHLKYPPEV